MQLIASRALLEAIINAIFKINLRLPRKALYRDDLFRNLINRFLITFFSRYCAVILKVFEGKKTSVNCIH